MILADGGVELLQAVAIFALAAFLMGFGVLLVGWLIRPRVPHPEKAAAYECGETPIGSGWVQFDLRFYVVALVFLVFDVEIALFYPWAVVFGGGAAAPAAGWEALQPVRWAGLWDMLFFFGVIVVGFLYLWRFGYLDWVRSIGATLDEQIPRAAAPPPTEPPTEESGTWVVSEAADPNPAREGGAPGPSTNVVDL
jgi:NADH-quinone oxidoreductase subunit A